jgi:hypothetical protein
MTDTELKIKEALLFKDPTSILPYIPLNPSLWINVKAIP